MKKEINFTSNHLYFKLKTKYKVKGHLTLQSWSFLWERFGWYGMF